MSNILIPSDSVLRSLQEHFAYDSATGDICHRIAICRKPVGSSAYCKAKRGYLSIKYKGRHFVGHRVAWFLFHGSWPSLLIDHRDGDRKNNSIENLRLASFNQNSSHRKRDVRNSLGLAGVTKAKTRGRWQSQIGHKGKRYYLGTYDSPEEAHLAYLESAKKMHGQFMNAGDRR